MWLLSSALFDVLILCTTDRLRSLCGLFPQCLWWQWFTSCTYTKWRLHFVWLKTLWSTLPAVFCDFFLFTVQGNAYCVSVSSLLSNSFSLIGAWGLMVVLWHSSPCWREGIGIFHVLLIILFCTWIVPDLSCCCYWPVDFCVQIYHGLSILTLLVLCWLKRSFLLRRVSYFFSIENRFLFI